MVELPCGECGLLDLSCCRNPQIMWTMAEVDELLSVNPDAMQDKVFLKGDVPGMIYIVRKPSEEEMGAGNIRLERCAFYDEDERNCSVYEQRPFVCKTFGDPKYAVCPYTAFTEEGSLTKALLANKEWVESLHKQAPVNPEQMLNDFILPWVESFQSAEDYDEYFEWWSNLGTPNWVRQ